MVYLTDTEKTDILPVSAPKFKYDWTSKILFWALICWSLCLEDYFVSRYMRNRTDVNTLNLLFVSGLD